MVGGPVWERGPLVPNGAAGSSERALERWPQIGPGFIWPAVGPQELQIIMLNDSDEASFINYVQVLYLQHKNPGLSNLPPGYQVLKTVQIEVHN